MANNMLTAVMNEPFKTKPPSAVTKPWNTSDASLLDEIDEIIIRRLTDAEEEGLTRAQLKHRAEYYGRMYDLVYARLSGDKSPPVRESADFTEQTYEFLAEAFWEKIEAVYDPNLNIAEKNAKIIIDKTRAKLKRLEIALFKGM